MEGMRRGADGRRWEDVERGRMGTVTGGEMEDEVEWIDDRKQSSGEERRGEEK